VVSGRYVWVRAVEVFAESRPLAGLLSDAGHNFTDALALLLAWFGFYLEARPANEIKTYGYHRAGVLSAFVNALTLLVLSAGSSTKARFA